MPHWSRTRCRCRIFLAWIVRWLSRRPTRTQSPPRIGAPVETLDKKPSSASQTTWRRHRDDRHDAPEDRSTDSAILKRLFWKQGVFHVFSTGLLPKNTSRVARETPPRPSLPFENIPLFESVSPVGARNARALQAAPRGRRTKSLVKISISCSVEEWTVAAESNTKQTNPHMIRAVQERAHHCNCGLYGGRST